MTIDEEIHPQRRFVPAIVPWLVAAAALVVYLTTLNHWMSFANMSTVSRLAGWTWQPERFGPVYWLATYPLHWLSAKSIPLALNIFSTVCGVLTLALLARSVALLPHDRTEEQRVREQGAFSLLTIRSAWLPPALAVIVCGLQLSFWESATGGSSEMLDLLVFAYVIRCLLEYRIDEQQKWVSRAAFVYGLGITNNWAMIGFLPVFLIALVWMKGIGFFNFSFLRRILLWSLAGLLLFLLLPLLQNAADIGKVPFWQALGFSLKLQKAYLTALVVNKQALFLDPHPLWIFGLFSILPLLVMSISWPAYFGDPSRLGVTIATLTLHFFHGVLLVVCIWLALDPQFSPRHNPSLARYGASGLSIYYLAALGVGYFVGYFLLVFGAKPKRPRISPPYMPLMNWTVLSMMWALLALTPAILAYRNLPQVRLTNGPMLKDHARLMLQDLPPEGVVLSDSPHRLALAQGAAAQAGSDKNYLFLDTASLRWSDYHLFLQKHSPGRLPTLSVSKNQAVGDITLINWLYRVGQSNVIYYLHPSFGYYFEVFYPEPHGLVYKLNPLPTNAISDVVLSQELFDGNNTFWEMIDKPQLEPIAAEVRTATVGPRIALLDRIIRMAHLKPEENTSAESLASFYSRALDFLGVQEQRSGALRRAGVHFSRAVDLNPDNVVAEINLQCNANLSRGTNLITELSGSLDEKLGKYRNLEQVMNINGPYDDPEFCYATALTFARGRLYRQAAREFDRAKVLIPLSTPQNLSSRLFLAQLILAGRMPERALQEIAEIHSQADLLGVNITNAPDVLSIEVSAHLARNDIAAAEAAVDAAVKKYPADSALLSVASRAYINYHFYTNSQSLIDRQLALTPDNPTALVNKGYTCLQLKNYSEAIPPLTRALDLQSTNYLALLNRACAYLGAEKLDDAQRDYEALQKAFPKFYAVNYGLGEVAYRRKENAAALRYYNLYLDAAPTNNPAMKTEIDAVRTRIKGLQASPP
jgi:tetratricopeptide (TPR) repeat protein